MRLRPYRRSEFFLSSRSRQGIKRSNSEMVMPRCTFHYGSRRVGGNCPCTVEADSGITPEAIRRTGFLPDGSLNTNSRICYHWVEKYTFTPLTLRTVEMAQPSILADS